MARSLSVQLQLVIVNKPEEIENAFSSMVRAKAEAVTVASQAMFVLNRTRIVELAAKYRCLRYTIEMSLSRLAASCPMGRTTPTYTDEQHITWIRS